MKKLLTLSLSLLTIASFAASPFQAKSEAEYLEAIKTSSAEVQKNYKRKLPIFKYQLGKDFTKIPYETTKAELKKIVDTLETSKTRRANLLFVTFRYYPSLRVYIQNVVEDNSLNTSPAFYNLLTASLVWTSFTNKDLLRTKLVEAILYQTHFSSYNVAGKRAGELINIYEKNTPNWKDEEIIKDLKTIRKRCYSKIASSEEWKTTMVKVELLLKAYTF